LVIGNIITETPLIADLGLPEVLQDIAMAKRGLILFVGGRGSGKTISLTALITYRNMKSKGHIITIEDPVEYLHPHKGCIINQCKVGVDTYSFSDALKNTLRQAPDVIPIGEIRDRETMEHALVFSETGHLTISTLHTNNANQALDRIVNFFSEERRKQFLSDLSINLWAFVSQRLIPTFDNKRCAAIEILLNSGRVADLIIQSAVLEIEDVMEKS
jgi:twitching motility protein PilU